MKNDFFKIFYEKMKKDFYDPKHMYVMHTTGSLRESCKILTKGIQYGVSTRVSERASCS